MQASKRRFAGIICAVICIVLLGSLFCVAHHGAHYAQHGGNDLCAECNLVASCQQLLRMTALCALLFLLHLSLHSCRQTESTAGISGACVSTLVALKVKLLN